MKQIVKYVTLGSLFLIPIFPLIVAGDLFFPFITGKAFYFRILAEVAFFGWVILAFMDARYRPKISPLTISVTIFALVTLVADLVGVNPIRSIWSNFERMEGWMMIIHLWAFFMAIVHTFGHDHEGKRMWRNWLNTSLGVASVIAVYGLLQFFGFADIHQSADRVDASLGNSAYMAVYMLFHVFIAAYFYFLARAKEISSAKILQWVYLSGAVIFGFLLFQTQTRGSMLGLIGGIMLALVLYAIFGRGESKKNRIIAGSIIGAIILIGVLFWANRDAGFVNSSPVFQRLASISWNASGQARQYVWPMAIKGFAERPILGWGQENFNYIFNSNYNPVMYNHEQWFDRAHSVFLDWLVASGAVGFVSYMALYVLAFMAIWKSGMDIKQKSLWSGLIFGYAIHNIFVFDNLSSYLMFFGVLGYLASIKEGKMIKWFGTAPAKKDVVEYVVAPIVVVALVASIYFLNARIISANTALIDALRGCANNPDVATYEKVFAKDVYTANQEAREQLLSCTTQVAGSEQIPGPTKQAFFVLTEREIQKQIDATPNDARIFVLGGAFYNAVGATDLALPVLERAYELSPKKQSIAYQLATAYLGEGQPDKAEAVLKEAYEAEKSNESAKQAYVIGLILNGKENLARTEFGDDSSLLENSRVADAYVSIKQYDKAIALFKKLASADPKNLDLRMSVSRVQYLAGQKWSAAETLRAIQKDFPEYTEQIKQLIEEVQK